MPFNKKSKPKEDNDSLPQALGIDEKRADLILQKVHALLHKHDNVYTVLVELNENLNDNELLYAAYAYGRMVEGHQSIEIDEDIMEKLDETVKGFMSFLDKKGRK